MDSFGYFGIFIALVGLVGGLLCYWGHGRAKARSQAAERWLKAAGTVIEAGVNRHGTSHHPYYVPAIAYDYVVNGRARRGSRIRFGLLSFRTRSAAEKVLAPYPAGAAIQVRYDPDNPDDSVLEPTRVGRYLLVWAILCGLLFLAGAAIVVGAMRGAFSSDVSGHWHVRFQTGGIVYEGDLEATHGAGPLTLAYTSATGPKRASEDCTLTRNGQHVLVRCANARLIAGEGDYLPDNFDLTYDGASRLVGSITSNGVDAGAATFTR
jgi:hypothetical protein